MANTLRDLQARLELLEQAVERLKATSAVREQDVTRVTAPLHVVDDEGNLLLEVGQDLDGGHVFLSDSSGRMTLALGCTPAGGFIDIVQAGSGRLALTLAATGGGGSIEVTDKDGNDVFIIPRDQAG